MSYRHFLLRNLGSFCAKDQIDKLVNVLKGQFLVFFCRQRLLKVLKALFIGIDDLVSCHSSKQVDFLSEPFQRLFLGFRLKRDPVMDHTHTLEFLVKLCRFLKVTRKGRRYFFFLVHYTELFHPWTYVFVHQLLIVPRLLVRRFLQTGFWLNVCNRFNVLLLKRKQFFTKRTLLFNQILALVFLLLGKGMLVWYWKENVNIGCAFIYGHVCVWEQFWWL